MAQDSIAPDLANLRASDNTLWPEPLTVHQPHQHSRVFIGPFPHTSASSSSATTKALPGGSNSSSARSSGAGRYLPAGEVEEGDDYPTARGGGRKRDVVRRQKRKVLQRRRRASSAGEWGDDDEDDEQDGGSGDPDRPDDPASRQGGLSRRLRRRARIASVPAGEGSTDGYSDAGRRPAALVGDADVGESRPPSPPGRLRRWALDARHGGGDRSDGVGAAPTAVAAAASSTTTTTGPVGSSLSQHGRPVTGLLSSSSSSPAAAVGPGVAVAVAPPPTQPTADEQALLQMILAPVRDEDSSAPAADRGWWKVRWQGDRRRMSVSSSIHGGGGGGDGGGLPRPSAFPSSPLLAKSPPASALSTTTTRRTSSMVGDRRMPSLIPSPTTPTGVGGPENAPPVGIDPDDRSSGGGGPNTSFSTTGSTTLVSDVPVLGGGEGGEATTLDEPDNGAPTATTTTAASPSSAALLTAPPSRPSIQRPSRQASRSSERSAETFYSARTELGAGGSGTGSGPHSGTSAGSPAALTTRRLSDNNDVDDDDKVGWVAATLGDRFLGDSGLPSAGSPSALSSRTTSSIETSFAPSPLSGPSSSPRKGLPRIVHTEASPSVSASSSFISQTAALPLPPSAAAAAGTAAPPQASAPYPVPLRSALRRPTTTTPPTHLVPSQTVHFPPTPPTPNPSSLGRRLVSDLRARTGPSPIPLEERAEVLGSAGGFHRRPTTTTTRLMRASSSGSAGVGGRGATATGQGVSGDGEPAPPEEVLNRPGGTGVEGDGRPMAAIPRIGQRLVDEDEDDDVPDDDLRVGDVLMRDRMLVKKQWCRSSGLPPGYNEQTQRKIPVDRSEAWEERLVVLKKGRVEIYDDWGLPFRERFVGVKKLVHVIYLQKETSLSLYSNTDLTFCLLTPPTSLKDARSTRSSSGIKSRMPRITRSGTSIFIFKIKSRTRAIDWMWELFLQLKGSSALPRYLDVHVPAFNNARVRLRVPAVGEDAGFDSVESVLRRLTRKQVIKHCARILSGVEGFRSLLVECGALSVAELEQDGGGIVRGDEVDKHLALAWRHGDRLDWIWADDDVLQQSRNWNVLAGTGPLQSLTQPAKLELRFARHTASILHLKSGTRVTEPPAVEGYLHRIRPKTGVKTLTYLTVHDGCIFICSPIKAHPPTPPADLELDEKAHLEHERPTTEAGFKTAERIRAIQQILGSNGFLDFRDIESVARATTEHVRRPRPASRRSSEENEDVHRDDNDDDDDDDDEIESDDEGWESLSDDERDLGGDEGLKAVEDHKTALERRQVVVRLTNGDSFVFEAHSALVAREWIERLNSLRIYWTEKHLEEAQQEMEVSRSTRIRLPAGLMGSKQRQWDSDDELEDPDDPPAYIEDFWNWCVLDACRPIVKAGRLFSKRRHWQFRAKYNILVHGHLVQFSLDLDRPIHTRSHRFFLIDAYVYTGYLAQEGLPPSSNEAAYLGKGEPRRYADGFQTDDGSEDTVLVIWYRPHFVTADKKKYIARAQQDATYVPPALGNSGHRKLVLRARSKLERDAWANALNLEIERLARRRKDREDRIRSTGNVL